MANLFAIHSVASSLMTYLRNAYPTVLRDAYPCGFNVISSGELAEMDGSGTMVSLYVYRATIDDQVSNLRQPHQRADAKAPLALNLHFLLTVWADNAVAEHAICGWVMQELHRHPIMDASSLSADGGWRPGETVQIVPAELSTEDLMRIWDALMPTYRLSVAYIGRVIRIDGEEQGEHVPVVATRFVYGEQHD